ncbi:MULTISPECIES: hypothetical protein [Methanobacterium]|uniref:Uncharacterized protein n=1 Tax=Methanobacterium veterum TaxID=408577 RepID=A0A9E5DPP4_9EURY|nr:MULTISPECIES: hypothetical protein [Methanobacterium]MCZ3364888.1 hypothetical protein [Methanobacterium veterum]MCZ3372643.1 hypothetical protein [Methanobacterium veterum]
MNDKRKMLISSILICVGVSYWILTSWSPFTLFIVPLVIALLLIFVLRIKNYNNRKIENIIGLAALIADGLILIYIYLFKSIYLTDTESYLSFYFCTGLLIFIFIGILYQKFPRKESL